MNQIFAEIITIGDEILYGQITDTNSQWISQELGKIGVKVLRKSSVGDKESEILSILKEAESRAEIILITGGLGPTNDDITKKTLTTYFNSKLVLNEHALEDVRNYFNKRGKELTEINKTQAYLPEVCQFVPNKQGTAPGMWFEKGSKVFVSMPGVPFEMKAMMSEWILSKVKSKFATPFLYHKNIRTVGIGESYLSEMIRDWENALPSSIKLAYLPSIGGVRLRLTGIGEDKEKVISETEKSSEKLLEIIKEFVYGFEEETLAEAIGKQLKKSGKMVGAAESCTGGYISHLFTLTPGSSDYFKGSVIAYHNEIKVKQLGVKESTLKIHGAVSEQTVKEMAEGLIKTLQVDYALAVSGIAGPGGGSEEKPVGTVWIACTDGKETVCKLLNLGTNREINIQFASIAALNLLRQRLS